MNKTLDTFFEAQMQEWPMARENHEALTKVWSRELPSPKLPLPLRIQCNPARLISTGAKIDKASIAARPCFLCAANRPKEQQSLALNEEFEWLVNPFPILQEHYTITSKQHRPQRFLDAYDVMIQATKLLPEGYIVFYNGPKCGASAPDHLHLQAGIAENIPLVAYAKSLDATNDTQAITPFGCLAYLIHDAENTDLFNQLYERLPIPEEEYEPRMNVVAYRKADKVTLIVIPRHAHRPQCYNKEGDAKYLISPGALDMCGLLITPRIEDYERLTAPKATDILCEVGVRTEPTIDVGIMQGKEIRFTLTSPLTLQRRGDSNSLMLLPDTYHASIKEDTPSGKSYIIIRGEHTEYSLGNYVSLESPLLGRVEGEATFSLHGVTIGKEFHWQQQETQTFQGALILRIIDGELHAINRIAIENYLTSVIASEMSGTSSVELLKAHAVISRSWLLAQIAPGASPKMKIENLKLKVDQPHNEVDSKQSFIPEANSQFSKFAQTSESQACLNSHCESSRTKNECLILNSQFIKWYDREAHTHFDVCADDHCQRYQGVSRKVTPQVHEAIRATRGIVLSYEGEVCDARFSKCCGGKTELYESCWDDTPHPYLSVVDDPFCNTDDPKILSEVLNHYDQSTDFYRWTVQYTQTELSELVRRRGGFDYGDIVDLIPIERGPSGRIVRLQIVGTKATRIIGKELEIRRTLSETHLYSSAFEVKKASPASSQARLLGEDKSSFVATDATRIGPRRGDCEDVTNSSAMSEAPSPWERDGERPLLFILHGSGWGHGVGLCQIGAAVMGAKGYNYKEILHHYYPKASLTEWYTPSPQCPSRDDC